MRIDSAGNVGIGTSSPAAKLHVEGTNAVMASTGLVTVQATTSGADVGGQITFQNNTARRAAIAGRQEASDAIAGYLQFGTRGTSGDITERMRIDSSGNVGIGTSSPNFTLQLDSQRADATFDANNLDTWADFKIQGQTASGNARGIYFDFDDDTENDRGAGIVGISGDATGGVGSLGFITTAGNTSAERMRIDSAGNLGLGVTPSAWRSSDTVFQVGPVASLNSDTDVTTDVGYNYFYNSSNIPIYSTTAQASRYSQYLGAHRFFTAPSGTAGNAISFTQAMTLTAAGDLGVGQTSPAAKLDIIGPSAESSPYLSKAIQFAPSNFPTRTWSLNYDDTGASGYGFNISAASTKILYLNTNGNVGIGTSSPTSISGYTALEVNGNSSGSIIDLAQGDVMRGRLVAVTGSFTLETSGSIPILFSPGGSQRARIDSDGLKFNGDTAAANALDDYEEGTWTGLIAGSTTAGTFTNLINSCSYTKIGRQVTVQYYVQWESGTGTGNLILTGLPFTSRNESGFYYAGTLSYANVLRTANATPAPNIYHNATQIEFLQIPTTDGDSTSIAYDAVGRLMGMHTYFTA
jgi:hypothetical protein